MYINVVLLECVGFVGCVRKGSDWYMYAVVPISGLYQVMKQRNHVCNPTANFQTNYSLGVTCFACKGQSVTLVMFRRVAYPKISI